MEKMADNKNKSKLSNHKNVNEIEEYYTEKINYYYNENYSKNFKKNL